MFKVTVSICSNLEGLRVLQEMEEYLRGKYEIVDICIIYPCGKKCKVCRTQKSYSDSISNSVYTATDYISQSIEPDVPVNVVYTTNFLL